MDNDLMARRLRPPSQPSSASGQQPAQPSSPWDVPFGDEGSLGEDGSFAPAEPQHPQQDPPFAPPSAPDPATRADVPWDRPSPDAWPPSEGAGTDYPQTWSAQGTPATPNDPQPAWPEADAIGEAAPWDRPASDQALDPDDAMAPVVSDVHAPVGVWHEWSGDANANGYANGYANGNGNGNGHYAAGIPEPMTVTAHSDQPRGGDEPRSDAWVDSPSGGDGPSLPEWPAEDDLTPPSSSRGPVMPEDSWPITPQEAAPISPPDPPVSAASPEPEPEPTAEPTPAPPVADRQTEMPAAPPAPPQPVAPPPAVTPVVTSAQIMPSPAGSPQNMVLRIELAIVDESRRANPADAAKRVGPDADVRAPEYNPRTHGGRAPMPEPEYEWGAPPAPDQRRQRQAGQPAAQPRHIAPHANDWQPAAPPAQPTQMDWDLPQLAAPEVGVPQPDQPAPWSTPAQPHARQPQMQPPAPPPTWALTEPTPPYTPEPPQYIPPPARPYEQQQYQPPAAPRQQQPAWPPSQSPDPLYGLPAATNQQPTGYGTAAYPPAGYPQQGAAPAAGSRARTGQANAADQADLWFLSNQPAATAADDDVQPMGKSSSVLTAALTVGFALLVIVLVLVFIQLMTSLLK